MKVPFVSATTAIALCLAASNATAASLKPSAIESIYTAPRLIAPEGSILVAQTDGDDAYDPFADYSEFEQSMDEEEDTNFFRNGRLLTLGFIGGYRGFTSNLGSYYSGNANFGLFLAYFFDLNFALQLGYIASDHTLVIPSQTTSTGTTTAVQGTVSTSDISILIKYYFNTQNVTRGLASLSPYLVGGFSQIYRTTMTSTNDEDKFAKDSAFGFNIGAGLEVPMMRNKMYWGVQGIYQIVNFANESEVVRDENDDPTGVVLRGDAYLLQGVLGINF